MKRNLLGLFFCSVALAVSASAEVPDWLQKSLDTTPGEWKQKPPAVQLLDLHTARFTAVDHVVEIYRSAVRVVSTAGKGRALFASKYDPKTERIVDLRAWVISADGKKTKTFSRDTFSDLPVNMGGVEWSEQREVRLEVQAQIEVGGVFAWEMKTESKSPVIDVGHVLIAVLPVESRIFEVIPPPGVKLLWHTMGNKEAYEPAAGAAAGSLLWTQSRLEALEYDELEVLYPKSAGVVVRCERPAGAEMDMSSWPGFSAAFFGVVTPQLETAGTVEAKAKELVAAKTSRWERIRALCEFAQRDIRYVFITLDKDYLAGCRPHRAADILKNRYGDCKDKATLLISMLGAIGEKGHFLLVSSADPFAVPEDWPSFSFNHVIVAVPADEQTPASWPVIDGGALGKLVPFDPTNPVAPLGVLATEDQGGWGLPVSSPGSGLVRMPLENPTHSGLERTLTATLTPAGGLVAELREDFMGARGANSYREHWGRQDERYGRGLEAWLHGMFSSMTGFRWHDEWDVSAARHRIDYHFEINKFTRRVGRDRMIFTPCVLTPHFTWSAPKRPLPIVMFNVASKIHEVVRIKLPENWQLEELPENWSMEQSDASCFIIYKQENDELVYESKYVFRGGFLDPSRYETMRQFRQRMQDAMRRPAILLQKKEVAGPVNQPAPESPITKAAPPAQGVAASPVPVPPSVGGPARVQALPTTSSNGAAEATSPAKPQGKIKFEDVVLKADPTGKDVTEFIAALRMGMTPTIDVTIPNNHSPEASITEEQVTAKLRQIPPEHIHIALKEAMLLRKRKSLRLPRAVIALINQRDDIGPELKQPIIDALSEYPLLALTVTKKQWWVDAKGKIPLVLRSAKKAEGPDIAIYFEALIAMDTAEARDVLTKLLTSGNGSILAQTYIIAKNAGADWIDWSAITSQAWKKAEHDGATDLIFYASYAGPHGVREALVLAAKKLNGAAMPFDEKDTALRKECLALLRQTIDIGSQDENALVQYVLAHRAVLIFDRATGKYKLPN